MSEGEKRSSSQAGLTEDEHGDSLAIHVDADVNNQNGSGGDDSEVERQLVSALGEVSGNRQKTVLPPPDVGDAGISDEEVHGADGHESSAHEGDDERETTPPPGAEDDDKEENWQPTAQEQTVNAEKRKASDAEGEDEEEEAAAAPLQAPKRKIKRRKKYEAEADHSAAIRARYEKMRESRTPIACDRCKNLRKECTSDIDGCLQCKAAGKECMQTDPVTLRTEKRGDSLRKDELIHILRAENRKLREVIRRLEYQVQLQMRGQINPLGTYQFQPRYRNRTPSPPGSSPWSNATPSSAEKGSGYLSKTGFSPVNNRALTRPGKPTNAEDPKKTGSPSERHANAPKSRATGSEGSGGSGGNSTRFPPAVPAEELEQRLNQGARARINNQFEALMARDPDFNQRAYSGAAGYESPGRPRLNGPGYASPFVNDYMDYSSNNPYAVPARASSGIRPHYDGGFINEQPAYRFGSPGYTNHPQRQGPPPYPRAYNDRPNQFEDFVDPRLQFEDDRPPKDYRAAPEATKDSYYDLPDTGDSLFEEPDLEFAYNSYFPDEATSAAAAEQARASRSRLKPMHRASPRGTPPRGTPPFNRPKRS